MSDPPGPTRTHVDPTLRLAAGARVAGRYRIEELLGIGGMGMVYRAHDEELGIEIALKLLRPELAVTAERLERLRREVLLARRVSHKAVVRTHDIGQDDGLWFLTMDFVAGRSLRKVLEAELRLEPERVRRIVLQLAQALAAAHAEGVVHRDLTPANVLIGDDDRVRITDFGLARSLAGGGPTEAGTVLGTLDYLSPEQARGEEADGRSDLFALGVIAFEMLTGELPFRGGSWSEVIAQRLHARPRALGESGVDVPEPLARAVSRCLEREPRRRPASAEALAAELGGERPAAAVGWLRPALAAAALALAVAAGTWWLERDRVEPAAAPAAAAPARAARHAVAVLPLRDETGRAELAWLGAGLAERLSESLAAEPDLRVVSSPRLASAVRDLRLGESRWPEVELRRIAELFETDRVVAGTVHAVGDRLEVELRFADGSGRETAGGERVRVDAAGGDVAALSARLLAATRARLDLAAAPAAAAERVPAAAFAAFAEGASRLAAGDSLAAVERLETAVADHPGYGAAWVRLAEAHAALGYDERALAAIERGIAALDDSGGRLALEARARRAALLGEPARARDLLAELAGRYPNDVDLAVARAEAAGDLGDLEEAERELARSVTLDPQHPRAWFLRGKFAILAGRPRAAVDEHLVRALVIQNRLRNAQGRADVLNAFGVGYRQLGDFDRALEQYAQAAELRRELGDRRGLATTLRNIAGIEAVRGELDQAEARLGEARTILQELGDRAGLADLHNERGVLAEERGRADQALDEYRRALELRRKLGDQRATAESLGNVGYAYFLLGQYDNADAFWRQALELHRQVGNVEGEIVTRQSVGQLALAQGEWPKAAASFLEALEASRRIGLEPAVAVSLGNLGRLAAYEGRFGAALASYREAHELLEKLGDPRGLVEFELAEAETWIELGRAGEAIERLAATEQRLDGGNHEQRAELLALRAAARLATGEIAAAGRAAAAGAVEAGASGSRVLAARLALAQGLVDLGAGRVGPARAGFASALETASALDHAWLELRAREALARAAWAAGDHGAAERQLRAALRRADRCGAYVRRWRLHAALATSLAESDAVAAEAERERARAELGRLTSSLDEAMRTEFEQMEDVRAVG